jgi:hypothetical protein
MSPIEPAARRTTSSPSTVRPAFTDAIASLSTTTLHFGSADGAVVNTVFVSLLASARLHDIEPHGYIRDLLCLVKTWPPDRLLELAPAYWKKTFEQPETQQKLAANVFRRAILSLPS